MTVKSIQIAICKSDNLDIDMDRIKEFLDDGVRRLSVEIGGTVLVGWYDPEPKRENELLKQKLKDIRKITLSTKRRKT